MVTIDIVSPTLGIETAWGGHSWMASACARLGVIESGGAAEADLRVGDMITASVAMSSVELGWDNSILRILGPIGSVVQLSILRKDLELLVSVTRRAIRTGCCATRPGCRTRQRQGKAEAPRSPQTTRSRRHKAAPQYWFAW